MLTHEQIEQLHTFCYKHSVRYYDVQVELVDHLANAIEDRMTTNPHLSFEEALAQVHKSFGVRGFAPLIEEKQKAVDRQSRRLLWRLFKQQFRWPNIVFGLMVFALSWSLLQFSSEKYFVVAALISLAVITGIMISAGYRLQRLEKRTGRQFLLLQFRNMFGYAFIPLNLINILNLFRPQGESLLTTMGIAGHVLACLIFTSFVLMAVATREVFKQMEAQLRMNYPTVFKSV